MGLKNLPLESFASRASGALLLAVLVAGMPRAFAGPGVTSYVCKSKSDAGRISKVTFSLETGMRGDAPVRDFKMYNSNLQLEVAASSVSGPAQVTRTGVVHVDGGFGDHDIFEWDLFVFGNGTAALEYYESIDCRGDDRGTIRMHCEVLSN